MNETYQEEDGPKAMWVLQEVSSFPFPYGQNAGFHRCSRVASGRLRTGGGGGGDDSPWVEPLRQMQPPKS